MHCAIVLSLLAFLAGCLKVPRGFLDSCGIASGVAVRCPPLPACIAMHWLSPSCLEPLMLVYGVFSFALSRWTS